MSYVSIRDVALLDGWEKGWTGESWFKKAKDGYEWQAYVHEDDDHITFVPVLAKRIPRKLTMKKYEELFND